MTTAAGVFLTACSKEGLNSVAPNSAARVGAHEVYLGAGEVGVLNYAYALEQLEAAFYIKVIMTPYSGMSAMEREILTDIRDHEIAHREFFKAALGSAAIPALNVDFSSINFNDRNSVLQTARTFEDVGVSAYNGAGQLLMNGLNLSTAGKIVSVEARHAAVIRDLIAPNTAYFAGDDVVDPVTGLDVVRLPMQVLPLVDPFIVETINASGLPTPSV